MTTDPEKSPAETPQEGFLVLVLPTTGDAPKELIRQSILAAAVSPDGVTPLKQRYHAEETPEEAQRLLRALVDYARPSRPRVVVRLEFMRPHTWDRVVALPKDFDINNKRALDELAEAFVGIVPEEDYNPCGDIEGPSADWILVSPHTLFGGRHYKVSGNGEISAAGADKPITTIPSWATKSEEPND